MPVVSANPLKDVYGFPLGYQRATTGLMRTIDTRVWTGYHKWGFVIYRGVYGDDALWGKFIALLKSSAEHYLRKNNQFDILGADLEWTIVEDRDTLEGARKDTVRARFRQWVAARSVERDGPGADGEFVGRQSPRFRCCVYVDQASFDSISAQWQGRWGEKRWELRGQVAIIDGTHGHHDEERYAQMSAEWFEDDEDDDFPEPVEEYYGPPIEGDSSEDVGWIYAEAAWLVGHYEELHLKGLDWETWHQFYKGNRPNAPPTMAKNDESLASVDLSRKE